MCRFFSGETVSSASEETPSEVDVVEKLRARRRLALMPETMAGSEPTLSLNVSPDAELESPAKPDLEEMPAEPLGRGRKRLSFPGKEQSIRAQLQGFGYSKSTAKRAKHTVDSYPLSLLDKDTSPTSLRNRNTTVKSPVKNPFAKSVMGGAPPVPLDSAQDSREVAGYSAEAFSSTDNPHLREHCTSQSLTNPGMMAPQGLMNGDTGVQMLHEPEIPLTNAQPATVAASTEPRCSFMTSEDYITTLPGLSSSSHSMNHSAEVSVRQNGRLLGHPSSQKVSIAALHYLCVYMYM